MGKVVRLTLRIPQAMPLADYNALSAEINEAVLGVMASGSYILGREVSSFEEEFSQWLNGGHVVGVGSGTDALEIALRACGVGRGDLVFTAPLTAAATIVAIQRCGAVPFLVDVSGLDMLLDPDALESAVRLVKRSRKYSSLRPAAVVPVHLYGLPANMEEIMAIAGSHDLRVVEDCAQAHGASVRFGGRWRMVGTIGDAAAFSFYPTKNLGGIGDAGAAVFRRRPDAAKARSIRQYGWDANRISRREGLNSRLDELQAAILRVKLRHLERLNALRCALAAVYDTILTPCDYLQCPPVISGRRSVYHQYVIRVKSRDDVAKKLKATGIGTAIHYPCPLHLQPAFRDTVLFKEQGLPVAEELCDTVLSLPMFPALTVKQSESVARSIIRICGKSGL